MSDGGAAHCQTQPDEYIGIDDLIMLVIDIPL
jgi:hypothetical protein